MGTEKYLVIKIEQGLFNRVFSMINGIHLGHQSGRKIFITGFVRDFTAAESDTIPIEEIIDVPYLNALIKKQGLNTEIVTDVPHAHLCQWPTGYNGWFSNLTELHEIIKRHDDYTIIGVRTPFCHGRCDEYFRRAFRFHPRWYDIASDIAQKLFNGEPFKAIHLRLEKYSLYTEDQCKNLLPVYEEIVAKNFDRSDRIYVCTGICKKGSPPGFDIAESFYRKFRIGYPNARDSDDVFQNPSLDMDEDTRSFITGKECSAIIDYIIALQSSTFYFDSGNSTFCQMIMRQKSPESVIKHRY